MKKIIMIALSLLIVFMTGCNESEDDGLGNNSLEDTSSNKTVVTTAAPTEVPGLYQSIPKKNNSVQWYQKYKLYAYDNEHERIFYTDFFDGPYDWDGVNIKFTCPKGLYLTIEHDCPVLYTHDIDDVDIWPKTIEGQFHFYPYLLQRNDMKFDDVDQAYCEKLVSGNLFGFDAKNTAYEKFDTYILYDYFEKDVLEYDYKVDRITTYCIMNNGTVIEAVIKQGTDYEKQYKDDLKKIVDSFGYSDVDYIP